MTAAGAPTRHTEAGRILARLLQQAWLWSAYWRSPSGLRHSGS